MTKHNTLKLHPLDRGWCIPSAQFWSRWKANKQQMIEQGFTVQKLEGVWYYKKRSVGSLKVLLDQSIKPDPGWEGLDPNDPHSQFPGIDMSTPPWD